MRNLILSTLLGLLCLTPEARAQLADSSGAYLGLSAGYSGSSGLVGPAVAAGYRQQNGLEYGVGLSLGSRIGTQLYTSNSTSLGASIGYSANLGHDVSLRLVSTGSYSTTTANLATEDPDQRLTRSALGLDVNAIVSRPLLTAGSVRLEPGIGVYASGFHALRSFSDGTDAPRDPVGLDAGLHVGGTLSFRLLGADVAVPLYTRISASGGRAFAPPAWSPTTGLRIRF